MSDMKPGDHVVSKKLGPGIWTVLKVYETTVMVTQNRVRHVRPTDWFTPATAEQMRDALEGGH